MSDVEQTTINQRLSILVDELERGSKASFANKIGVAVQSIHDLIGGRKGMPSFKVISSILEHYPTVDANWLVMGRGQMLRGQAVPSASKVNELLKLTKEYIEVSKQLDGKKAAHREATNDLAHLRAEVQHNEAALQVEAQHRPHFNQEAQALIQEIIQQRQELIKRAQDRYSSFLLLQEQAEEELLKTMRQLGRIEARVNSLLSESHPPAEPQL